MWVERSLHTCSLKWKDTRNCMHLAMSDENDLVVLYVPEVTWSKLIFKEFGILGILSCWFGVVFIWNHRRLIYTHKTKETKRV